MAEKIEILGIFGKGGVRSLESPTPARGQNGSESAGERRTFVGERE